MLVGLHTADHIRLASPVQEAEGAPAAGDRTRILWLPVGEQENPLALRLPHHRRRVFSALLEAPHPCSPSLGWGRQHWGHGPLRRP
jgi:hypothetical protein